MKKVALLAVITLSACSHDRTAFPSLGVRATEKIGFAEPEALPPEPLRADPALDAKIAAVAVRLRTIGTGFDADAARAERSAKLAKGRAVGSEAWIDAQTALATLDDWRAQASGLASEVGQLASDRAATLAPPYPALDDLQRSAAAEATRQDAVIGRIQGSLPAG